MQQQPAAAPAPQQAPGITRPVHMMGGGLAPGPGLMPQPPLAAMGTAAHAVGPWAASPAQPPAVPGQLAAALLSSGGSTAATAAPPLLPVLPGGAALDSSPPQQHEQPPAAVAAALGMSVPPALLNPQQQLGAAPATSAAPFVPLFGLNLPTFQGVYCAAGCVGELNWPC